MKKFASLLFILGLVFSVQAQTTGNASVKDLRKSLVKNSRYQFQEILLQFAANDFKTCDVSYRFERLGSIGNENFGQATLDRSSPVATDINNANSGRKIIESDGITTRVITRNRPQFPLTQSTFFNTGYVTTFKLSDLNPDAVEITSTSKGVYLSLKTLESKASIQKDPVGSGADPMKTNSEFLPIVSQKKAEKVKELFVRAIKQCSEQS
jgi:hypothetical protein